MTAKKTAKKATKKLSKSAEAAKRSAAAKKAAVTRAANKAARRAELDSPKAGAITIMGEASYNANDVAVDNVYYVVMERGILSAKARSLHATRDSATAAAKDLEDASAAVYNKFTVQRVELVA